MDGQNGHGCGGIFLCFCLVVPETQKDTIDGTVKVRLIFRKRNRLLI